MNSFNNYMDKIKAENNLKENTKENVLTQLKSAAERNGSFKEAKYFGRYTVKKLATIAAAAVLCIGLATGAFAYYDTPVSYLSVDINPSVELGINGLGRVVRAIGINDDGKFVLDSANIKNQSVKDAVSNLVKAASENGYITNDGTTVISVTAESDDQEKASELQKESEESVNNAIKAKNILAVVYANCSDLKMRTEAKELGISPGKYKVIQIMQSLDPSLKAADYKDAKMTDLIVKADELLASYKNGTLTTDQQIAFKKVETAAEKVKDAADADENASDSKGVGQDKDKTNNGKSPNAGGKNNITPSPSPAATPNPSTAAVSTPAPTDSGNKSGNNGKSDSAPGNSAKAKENGKGLNKD